jgi:hypothetical protein
MHGIQKAHANTLPGAIGRAGNFGDAEPRRICGENGGGAAELIEHDEDFELRFHFVGNGLDDEIGLARCFIDRTGILQPRESCVGLGGIDRAEFDSLVARCPGP